MKLWTPRRSRRGMPNVEAPAGCQAWPRSAGVTAWAGTQASTCSCRQSHPRYLSVGKPALGPYLSDKGFEGQAAHARWGHSYGAQVMCPPKWNSHHPRSQRRRRWLAGVRQLVETVYDNVQHAFGLSHERSHAWSGFQARLAAKMALHNFCIQNQHL
jgi:hypothetical protein